MSFQKKIFIFILLFLTSNIFGQFPTATKNDPYPLFSSFYPYSYLATRQKAYLMRFEYAYPVDRFRASLSAFGQWANRARDAERNVINIGDINGRWNMLGLFYDTVLRNQLFKLLDINLNNDSECFKDITDPKRIDANKEFGFFTIPVWYRKYGARFESELLLINRCFYAVGIRMQWGISEVRQTIMRFEDLTCQALGIACPANRPARRFTTEPDQQTKPQPAEVTGITSPFIDPTTQPPCPPADSCLPPTYPAVPQECVTQPQPFTPCTNETCCLSFDCECKTLVMEQIMKEREKIAKFLGLDICNYQKVGIEDLRLDLFWRQIFVINEESDVYPRLLFMPFAELGGTIPMERHAPTNKLFAVPIGNNGYASVSGKFGWTLDFLDSIDLTAAGGFSYFFKQDLCDYRLPTSPFESGIFPYTADVTIRPGPTWFLAFGIHAYRFLDNLSVWFEYIYLTHDTDKIKICRSSIPSTSKYFKTGFDVERAECLTSWDSHMFNIGFNYELSDHFLLGTAIQIPLCQRNSYRSSTALGTLSFIF